jgi:hypothetical protein
MMKSDKVLVIQFRYLLGIVPSGRGGGPSATGPKSGRS